MQRLELFIAFYGQLILFTLTEKLFYLVLAGIVGAVWGIMVIAGVLSENSEGYSPKEEV